MCYSGKTDKKAFPFQLFRYLRWVEILLLKKLDSCLAWLPQETFNVNDCVMGISTVVFKHYKNKYAQSLGYKNMV